MTDVVVTGIGTVTPLGEDAPSTWSAMQAGVSGAGPITRFDPSTHDQCVDIGCEVEADLADHPRVNSRRMGRFAQLATVAADEAVGNAGLDPDGEDWTPERVGTSLGSGIGGLPETEAATQRMPENGRLSPRFVITMLPNLAAGHVSIELDAAGPNRSQSTACAAGTHSICDAVDDVRLGRADVMVAGGTESVISPTGIAGFAAMRALSTRSDEPAAASRPFDEDRDGFVMAEGAGVLVLESREHATDRGADVLAELSGVGLSADADHPTKPREDASGLVRAIEMALDDADRTPGAVDHVNAHATSTPRGDVHEARALQTVFDDVPPVTAPKSMLGHPMGASGAIEAVTAVQTIRDGSIPPTINCEAPDPACDVPLVTERTDGDIDVVVSNSAGFGGTNGVLCFEAPDNE